MRRTLKIHGDSSTLCQTKVSVSSPRPSDEQLDEQLLILQFSFAGEIWWEEIDQAICEVPTSSKIL